MSSIDDLFGDLGGATDVVIDKAKEYGPTALSMVASIAGWHALEAAYLTKFRDDLFKASESTSGASASLIVGNVVEMAAGVWIASLFMKHRPLGSYSDQAGAGVAIGLVFDATWRLLKQYLPADLSAHLMGLSDSKIYLADADPYHLLAAAPMLVEQVSGAPISISGAPITIAGFSGAPMTVDSMSGVGSTLTASM